MPQSLSNVAENLWRTRVVATMENVSEKRQARLRIDKYQSTD